MTSRQLTLAQLACVALLTASLAVWIVRTPHPVGPFSTSIRCEWSSETNDYQTIILYRDRHNAVIGRSQPSGRCAP